MPDNKTAFIDKRIKVRLNDATLLRRGEERRHHFAVSVNLSEGDTLTGMPSWIQDWYTLIQKAASYADGMKSKRAHFENMSLGFYSTFKTRQKFFSQVNGATLSSFVMRREGKGDDADVFMDFSIHMPGRREIHDWTYDHKTADLWMDFEQQQGELPMQEEEAEEDED